MDENFPATWIMDMYLWSFSRVFSQVAVSPLPFLYLPRRQVETIWPSKRPASAFLPVFNCISPASAFRHQGQSGTSGHGLVRHCPANALAKPYWIYDIASMWAPPISGILNYCHSVGPPWLICISVIIWVDVSHLVTCWVFSQCGVLTCFNTRPWNRELSRNFK